MAKRISSQTSNISVSPEKSEKFEGEKIFFKLKSLHGDQQIYLGQSILALVALNQSPTYSDEINKSFIIELFASLIEELNITPEELKSELNERETWNIE